MGVDQRPRRHHRRIDDRCELDALEPPLDAPELVICVAEEGIGIEPHMLSCIFEMFAQGEPAVDQVEGGLGIGLSLVKGLVTLHNGTVEAISGGSGKGSVFTVRLPLSKEVGGTVTAQAPMGADRGGVTARRILVVDDNRDIAESLGMLLQIAGHDTWMAYDGQHAVEVADTFEPEVVVFDIGMPHLDGHQTVSELRKRAWAKPAKAPSELLGRRCAPARR